MKYADKARTAVAREVYREFRNIMSIDKILELYDNLDVYVVWACYILGNEKYLISTNIPDNKYYEVTVDTKDKNVMYVDTYVKASQSMIQLNRDAQDDASSD